MKHVIRSIQEAERALIRERGLLGEVFEKPQTLEIKPFRPNRSLPQNARFHAMVNELASEIGYTPSELKDWLKIEYGPHKEFNFGDHISFIPKSTTEYTRTEMSDLMIHVEQIGAMLGFRFSDENHT